MIPTSGSIAQAPKLSAAQRLYASASLLSADGPSLSVPGAVGESPDAFGTAPHYMRASPVPSARSTPNSSDAHRPLNPRSQSQGSIFTTATNPSNYYNSQRSSTYPSYTTQSQTKFNSSAPLGGNQTRHLVTKAQPPSLLLGESIGAGAATTSPPLQAPIPAPGIIAQQKLLPALPPPVPISVLNAAASPPVPSPPYISPVNEKKQPLPLQVINPSLSPVSPTQHSKRASVAVLKNVGKQIGVAAAKFVASGVSTALTGIDVTTLADAFTGTSFDLSNLQAVLQAQPNADYSAAIAALQQQQLQQPSPTVDYAALINQIQQLQALAIQQQQQQQQIFAMQMAQLNQQNNAILAAQQQPMLSGNGAQPGATPNQQSPPPFYAQGSPPNPAPSTNPFAYSPTSNSPNQQIPPSIQPVQPSSFPPGYQPQQPQYPPQASPPQSYNATHPATGPASPPQNNLYQTLQAQQAAATQQLQAQMQQYQQASQAQQQALLAQIQQQSQAMQAQQQAAIAQAVQQQQQAQAAQQQQTQAWLNSFVPPPPPPPATGPSFTDVMATYLNGALNGGQTDPAATAEVPPSYSGIMSSLGLGGGTDLSSLDLSSSFGALDLSSMSSDALNSLQYAV